VNNQRELLRANQDSLFSISFEISSAVKKQCLAVRTKSQNSVISD
jgi:hypothetical protein